MTETINKIVKPVLAIQFFYAVRLLVMQSLVFFVHWHYLYQNEKIGFIPRIAPWDSLLLIATGILGIWAALRRNYYMSLVFCILQIFILVVIAITGFQTDPQSTFSIRNVLDMLGAVWLIFQIKVLKYKNF